MRVVAYEPLFSPAALLHELPLCDAMATAVELSRAEVRAALDHRVGKVVCDLRLIGKKAERESGRG